MNIKFRQLPVKDIDGKDVKVDFTAEVGNTLFNQAYDVSEHDLGVKIYHEQQPDKTTGKCKGTDLNDKEVGILRKFLPSMRFILRNAIENAMKQ